MVQGILPSFLSVEQASVSETKEETDRHDIEIAVHAIAPRETLEVIIQEDVPHVPDEFYR